MDARKNGWRSKLGAVWGTGSEELVKFGMLAADDTDNNTPGDGYLEKEIQDTTSK